MYSYSTSKHLFHSETLDQYLQTQQDEITEKIKAKTKAQLEHLDLDKEAALLANAYIIQPLELEKEKCKMLDPEKQVIQDFGRSYEADVAVYQIPFKGKARLFDMRPNRFSSTSYPYSIGNSNLELRVLTRGRITSESIQQEVKSELVRMTNYIEGMIANQRMSLDPYNAGLKQSILSQLQQRQQALLRLEEIKTNMNPFA